MSNKNKNLPYNSSIVYTELSSIEVEGNVKTTFLVRHSLHTRKTPKKLCKNRECIYFGFIK